MRVLPGVSATQPSSLLGSRTVSNSFTGFWLERTSGDDADAGVRAELGRADDPLDVERLFLEFVKGDLVDVGVADDLEDLLVDARAKFLDLGRDGNGVDDELL